MKTKIKSILIILLFCAALFSSCERDNPIQSGGNKTEAIQKGPVHGDYKLIVTTGIHTYECDYTDDRFIDGGWVKILYRDGSEWLWLPYEFNPEGFTTR